MCQKQAGEMPQMSVHGIGMPCSLDDGCCGTVSLHSLVGRASGMCRQAWQCCKQTCLHEVNI